MKTTLDANNELAKVYKRMRSELYELAHCMSTLGMKDGARNIYDHIETMDKAIKSLDSAIGHDINEAFDESQKSSAVLLKTALAGAYIEGGGNNESIKKFINDGEDNDV